MSRVLFGGDGIPHLQFLNLFQAGNDVTNISRFQPLGWNPFQHKMTHLSDLPQFSSGHELGSHSRFNSTVKYAYIGNCASIGIKIRIKDEGPRCVFFGFGGRWDPINNSCKEIVYTFAGLGADIENLIFRTTD